MKKAFKIIVPILLVIAILASMYWYCFVFDREFTRDVLLSQARYHAMHANPSLASWFYNLAYHHSGQDENVAIELANQFKSSGNYTKAEYTLSNAIADGGTTELYIALCKTYVEQDKLLDAVNMLDNVSDPTIKKALDAMRPAAPSADPVPGFYSYYLNVALSAEGGTLYYTTGSEYPSIDDIPYSDPIPLPGGETVIRAVTVADNGLVSPLVTLGYTVGGVIEEISLIDPPIEQAIRELLGLTDETLYSNQLWPVLSFTVPEDAKNYVDLTRMPYLESLTIHNQTIDSLQFLSSLTRLQELDLSGCRISPDDLSYIAALPSLKRLNLSNCSLSTIAGLENAHSLTNLNLAGNTIRNLEPLSGIVNLQEIDLQHNALTSLTALSTLSNLEQLNVSFNSLTSIVPLATCVRLAWLDVSNNQLPNLGAVDNLAALSFLNANNNDLTEVTVLANCRNLTDLAIANNSLTDISALSALTKLEVLDFSYNEIEDLPAWTDDCMLRVIDGSYNKLASIDGLGKMQNLTHVYMDYNEITSVAALESCYNLVLVNVYGNKVEGTEKLKEHDIIVNYDPT